MKNHLFKAQIADFVSGSDTAEAAETGAETLARPAGVRRRRQPASMTITRAAHDVIQISQALYLSDLV